MAKKPPKMPRIRKKKRQDPEMPKTYVPPRAIGSLQMETQEGEDAYRVAESAYDGLINLGIHPREWPPPFESQYLDDDGVPRIPGRVVDLENDDLGDLFHIVGSYATYVNEQLGLIENQYDEAKKQKEFIAAKVRLGKDGKQTDKTNLMTTDRRFVLADAKELELRCLSRLMTKVAKGLETDLKMLSRHISLRDQKIKTAMRSGSIDSRKIPSGYFLELEDEETLDQEAEMPEERRGTRRPSIKPPRRRKL